MKIPALAIIALFLLAANATAHQDPVLEGEIKRLRSRAASLESENRELRDALGDSEASKSQLSDALERSEVNQEQLAEERDKLKLLSGIPSREQAEALIVARYDEETDRTIVTGRPQVIPMSAEGLGVPHSLGARYEFAGREPAGPVTEASILITTSANVDNRYRKLDAVTLSSQNVDYPLSVSDYEASRRTRAGLGRKAGSSRYDERITAVIDYATLGRVTSGGSVHLKIGRRDYDLTVGHEALLAAVRERMRETGAR